MITVRDEVEVVTRKPEGAADVVLYTDLLTIRMRAEHDKTVPEVAGGHFQAIETADWVVGIGSLVWCPDDAVRWSVYPTFGSVHAVRWVIHLVRWSVHAIESVGHPTAWTVHAVSKARQLTAGTSHEVSKAGLLTAWSLH